MHFNLKIKTDFFLKNVSIISFPSPLGADFRLFSFFYVSSATTLKPFLNSLHKIKILYSMHFFYSFQYIEQQMKVEAATWISYCVFNKKCIL